MNVSTRGRLDLKSYFQKNDIPTESNFADLIDGMLNEKDDGLVRMPGDPLSIEAAGDAAGPKKLLNFYGSFNDAAPSWSLSLNPWSKPADPTTAVPGFTISDGAGTVRLFIDQKTGFVGIGTTSSQAPLDVGGQVRIGLDEGGSGLRSISFARDAEDEQNAGKIAYKGSFATQALSIVGAGKTVGTHAIKMWDDVEITGRLTVDGGIIQRSSLPSGSPTTTTQDLGLYSLQLGFSVRFVTNNGPFYFFTDPTKGFDREPGVDIQKAVASIGIDGSFTSARNKKFKITHPNRAGFDLIHSCLEGPENGVYYRGEGRLVAGHAVVMLPEYFEALTRPEGVTVQLTPKGPRPFLLSYSDVSGGSFHVHGTQDDGAFAWELKAVRADLAPLEVEVPSAERNGVEAVR